MTVESRAMEPCPTPSGPEGSSGRCEFDVPRGGLARVGRRFVHERSAVDDGAQPFFGS